MWLWKDHGDFQNSFGLCSRKQAIIWWTGNTQKTSLYENLGLRWFIEELGWEEVPEDLLPKLLIGSNINLNEFQEFKNRHTYE